MHHFWNQLLEPALKALSPRSIVEIGVGEGCTTVHLATYAAEHQATLTVIDPFPRIDLAALSRRTGIDISLHRKTSLDALPSILSPDAVLIDGDHNWYTVYQELCLLRKGVGEGKSFPVVFLHDISWPYGRRDMYFFPGNIPSHSVQPHAVGGVEPGREFLVPGGGLNTSLYHALSEHGPRNGVRTAIEDFLKESSDLCVMFLEGFHGIAILYPSTLPRTNPLWKEFLATCDTSSFLQAHVQALERDRLHQQARTEAEKRSRLREQSMLGGAREIIAGYEAELASLREDLRRVVASKSWRFTKPIRYLEAALRSPRIRFSRKNLIVLASSFWRSCGQPFPTVARFLRHRILGRMFPAAPSATQLSNSLAERVLSSYGGAPSLSVLVTARNNGLYLRECLTSVLEQSVKPMEVIYCDDGSTDKSVSIARSIPGVTVLEREHEGVVKARNAAAALSTGNLLLHVDGDDVLLPDYIAHQLAALVANPDAVFAYGGCIRSGMETTVSEGQPWSVQELWKQNYINTSSIIRRSVFEAAGRWQEGVGTLWDWDLWLRVSRFGRGVVCPSMLLYRRHIATWSNAVGRSMDDGQAGELLGRVRRAAARVSVCCIFGGRLPELLPLWMESLSRSIRAHIGSVQAPELVVLDHSCKHQERITELALETGVFRTVTVVPYREKFSWNSEMERRHKVAMFLSTAYNRLLALSDGDILWFLEDDVVVPEHAYDTLLKDLTDGNNPVAAVSGLYRNRHQPDFIAHRVDAQGNVRSIDITEPAPFPIDLAGTGCLMALRPLVPYQFTSHWRGIAPAHDWTWSEQIRCDQKTILLDTRVHCRHYADLTTYV